MLWLCTGLKLNPRVLKFSHLDATYNPSSIVIRPMALYQAVIHLLGPSAEQFNATTATQVVSAVRTQLVGTIGSDVTLGYYANDLQVRQLCLPWTFNSYTCVPDRHSIPTPVCPTAITRSTAQIGAAYPQT